jgi:hypothetical protein
MTVLSSNNKNDTKHKFEEFSNEHIDFPPENSLYYDSCSNNSIQNYPDFCPKYPLSSGIVKPSNTSGYTLASNYAFPTAGTTKNSNICSNLNSVQPDRYHSSLESGNQVNYSYLQSSITLQANVSPHPILPQIPQNVFGVVSHNAQHGIPINLQQNMLSNKNNILPNISQHFNEQPNIPINFLQNSLHNVSDDANRSYNLSKSWDIFNLSKEATTYSNLNNNITSSVTHRVIFDFNTFIFFRNPNIVSFVFVNQTCGRISFF